MSILSITFSWLERTILTNPPLRVLDFGRKRPSQMYGKAWIFGLFFRHKLVSFQTVFYEAKTISWRPKICIWCPSRHFFTWSARSSTKPIKKRPCSWASKWNSPCQCKFWESTMLYQYHKYWRKRFKKMHFSIQFSRWVKNLQWWTFEILQKINWLFLWISQKPQWL